MKQNRSTESELRAELRNMTRKYDQLMRAYRTMIERQQTAILREHSRLRIVVKNHWMPK